MPPEKFRVALVQMSCGPEPEQNLEKALNRVREAARRGAQSRLPAGTFSDAVLLPARRHALFDLAEPIPGPTHRSARGTSRERAGVVIVASLFERRAAGVYHNTAVVFDADGSLRGLYRKMHIPDDPLYYEKFYFTPGDLGFRAFDTAVGTHRHAGLLGPVVSRRRAPDGAAGRRGAVLSDRDRLASGREGRVRRGAARRLAHHPARARHRQRRLRRGGESRRPRNRRRPRQAAAGQASSSGAASFVCDPFGRVIAEGLARQARKSSSAKST